MTGWLLDTNVLSELRRPRPEAKVLQFVSSQKYETVGLDLFEKLLDANLREARAALEVLDRKPTQQIRRRSRRPRRPRRRPLTPTD